MIRSLSDLQMNTGLFSPIRSMSSERMIPHFAPTFAEWESPERWREGVLSGKCGKLLVIASALLRLFTEKLGPLGTHPSRLATTARHNTRDSRRLFILSTFVIRQPAGPSRSNPVDSVDYYSVSRSEVPFAACSDHRNYRTGRVVSCGTASVKGL